MWLHIPPQHLPETDLADPSATSSASAPGSAGSSSESSSPLTPWENRAAASCTWRGKPQQPQAWSRRWKQGGFIRLLSGLTCSPLMADRGAASFISSLRAIPARTTPLPESAPGPMANASSPPKWSASLPSAGLILSSARTCRGTPADSLRPLSRHWNDWATALRQEYSARPKPATPCGASDCSSWPSARVERGAYTRDRGNPDAPRPTLEGLAETWRAPSDISKRGGSQPSDKRQAGGQSVNLEDQAEHWMGPQVPNGGRSTSHAEKVGNTLYHGDKKVQLGLESQVKSWSSPKASDPEKAGPNMRGSKGDVPLPGQAAQWAASCGRTASQGPICCTIRPNSSSTRHHPRPQR